MFFKNKSDPANTDILNKIDKEKIPKHVAIIMDGNGRWAKKRGLPRAMGHRAGVETIREIVKTSSNLGIKYLTLYAFSTENWKRPKDEVNTLMTLLLEFLKKEIDELHKNNVVVRAIGDISQLPRQCIDELDRAYTLTKNNKGLCLNLALNYGARDEIKKAIINIANQVKKGNIGLEDIDDKLISDNLYTKGIPDPDLLIRPSGEYRISNYLLWQIAYTEFWFSDIYWPDFKPIYLYKAIYDYQNRSRRFGGV
ncbi:MAG: isoprenyl transferase [Clostridiales bacterium]|jgi:undecaprenyl diphosphate synthase|nr:isoprenyl transferase [Clostridiales bacterium]